MSLIFNRTVTRSLQEKKILTELLINDTLSAFHSMDRFAKDSAFFHSKLKTALIATYISTFNQINFEIFKRQDRIEVYEPLNGLPLEINNKLYTYSEPTESFRWQIHGDTVTISGMLCQKATIDWGGRHWVAWFTSEIPINNGPYKFQGLPGLIVSIADDRGFFAFSFVSINQTQKHLNAFRVLRPDLEVISVTKQEFYKRRRYLRENMYEIALASGSIMTEKHRQYAEEVKKKDNNHIEVY